MISLCIGSQIWKRIGDPNMDERLDPFMEEGGDPNMEEGG